MLTGWEKSRRKAGIPATLSDQPGLRQKHLSECNLPLHYVVPRIHTLPGSPHGARSAITWHACFPGHSKPYPAPCNCNGEGPLRGDSIVQHAGHLSPDCAGPTPGFVVWGRRDSLPRAQSYARAKYPAINDAAVPTWNATLGNVAFARLLITDKGEAIGSSVWARLGGKAYPLHATAGTSRLHRVNVVAPVRAHFLSADMNRVVV